MTDIRASRRLIRVSRAAQCKLIRQQLQAKGHRHFLSVRDLSPVGTSVQIGKAMAPPVGGEVQDSCRISPFGFRPVPGFSAVWPAAKLCEHGNIVANPAPGSIGPARPFAAEAFCPPPLCQPEGRTSYAPLSHGKASCPERGPGDLAAASDRVAVQSHAIRSRPPGIESDRCVMPAFAAMPG